MFGTVSISWQCLMSGLNRTANLRVFYWVLFSGRPLQLSEWADIITLIETTNALNNGTNNPHIAAYNEEQLEKRFVAYPVGLWKSTTAVRC